MMQNTIKYNEPIRTLLRDFEDKRSGKVVEARKEIRRRFDYIDGSQQIRFLYACFNSGKMDREWAYQKVLQLWNPQFEPVIHKLWHEYHEKSAALCMAKHFSTDVVLSELPEIDNKSTHYDLCLRFVNHHQFKIDTSKLTPLQVLSIYTKTNYSPSYDEIAEQLYRVIENIANKYTAIMKISGRDDFSCRNFIECGTAYYLIFELKQYDLLGEFSHWDEFIVEQVKKSDDFHKIQEKHLSDIDYCEIVSTLFKKFMLLHLSQLKNHKKEL